LNIVTQIPPLHNRLYRHAANRNPSFRGDDVCMPMMERYPLVKTAKGYARTMSGKGDFPAVLTM
jgi:hypothetical protein